MTARPARVLWVIKGLGPGGAERLVADIVPRLDRDRFRAEVAYLLPWKDHLVPELRAAGIPVRCLEVRRHADPRWVGRLRRLLEGGDGGGRVDLVHAHLPFAAIGARVAARRVRGRRPAVVYTEHNLWDRYRGATARLNAATFSWNDRVIAVSAAVAASIRARSGGPPVTVIENGVDGERLRADALPRAEARSELGATDDDLVIGTLGGITAKKGHRHLVRAARRVLERCPRALFLFVGLGADEEPVRREIAEQGVGERVRLLGYRERASRLLPGFDLFCLSSLDEGLPVALLEELALGVPAVATRVGGVPDVLAAGGGVVVEPGDAGALAAGLIALAEDPDRRAALAARAPAVADRYGLERTVRAVEGVYDEVLHR